MEDEDVQVTAELFDEEKYKKNIEDFYNDFIDFCQGLNEEV